MNYKFLLSTKSSGICFNIMRLIILTEVATKYKRSLIFLTKKEHIPILNLFNSECKFIEYVDNHTTQFNNFTRKQTLNLLYDLKYLRFLRDTYIDNIINTRSLRDFKFICGSITDITNCNEKILAIDYNDGNTDADIISCIKSPMISRSILADMFTNYNNEVVSINIKVNNSSNQRIFEMWDKLIRRIQTDYNKPILLVSGNNEIKNILGKKYNCIFNNTVSETNYSLVRGNNIVRGSAYNIFSDALTCTTTKFIPFTEIRIKYADILKEYTDINFVVEKVEKFDILVEYMIKNLKVN